MWPVSHDELRKRRRIACRHPRGGRRTVDPEVQLGMGQAEALHHPHRTGRPNRVAPWRLQKDLRAAALLGEGKRLGDRGGGQEQVDVYPRPRCPADPRARGGGEWWPNGGSKREDEVRPPVCGWDREMVRDLGRDDVVVDVVDGLESPAVAEGDVVRRYLRPVLAVGREEVPAELRDDFEKVVVPTFWALVAEGNHENAVAVYVAHVGYLA